ncbi:MAG: hypothetical protein Fur0037_03110 [Planctomycetota bacterium]
MAEGEHDLHIVSPRLHEPLLARGITAWPLVLCGMLFVLARSRSWFSLPSLEFEDGASIYAWFYQHRDPAEILRFKADYLPLPQNVLGWLSVRMDPRLAPYVLTFVPWLFTGWVFARVANGPCRRLVRDRGIRGLLPFALLVAPLGQIHLLRTRTTAPTTAPSS